MNLINKESKPKNRKKLFFLFFLGGGEVGKGGGRRLGRGEGGWGLEIVIFYKESK